ncbi:hypothetical protein SS1G_08846 [Sclerotinia sclerotiorum 1980 UF-70]|uniref:Proteasome assembly chaperone 3 n=2 Tax=Sclerotinia sclerotiorum (strain ATCC 18683 / 1980 / Ss-1) TaxID=665079 RepID=A7EU39_SCLS1|nr:hypothetical protein SS1G_08846 [Sclerotinia sclerotiorum 1980 UF-70]APA15229.1 hypothetical protein sscle_14g099990 [Sclerotinia sclerotiorum 1980 UF-70]EDN92981.1 hypothetical protein SS1G_08846 [Sclerotinia sclerotiorum 1980 UF-70]
MTTTTSPLTNLPANSDVYPSPFPARSKTASAMISGVPTDVSCMYFADRILVTISQGGRLGQWIQIPLTSASPTSFDTAIPLPSSTSTSISNGANMILPLEHLTPRTLLGAAGEKRERIAHLYASQIGSMILGRDPEERRTVLLGLGLEEEKGKESVGAVDGEGEDGERKGREGERMEYFDLLELVGGVL